MLCALLMMTFFASCGDSQDNSSDLSGSVSDTDEKITDSFPLITDEINLDSSWECDYLKIATCSKWKEESEIDDDEFTACWRWSDKDFSHRIYISLSRSIAGKMSQLDLQKTFDDILNIFVKNGQAYIITGSEDSTIRFAYFYADTVQGMFSYSVQDEEIVMDMIDSIEFY